MNEGLKGKGDSVGRKAKRRVSRRVGLSDFAFQRDEFIFLMPFFALVTKGNLLQVFFLIKKALRFHLDKNEYIPLPEYKET